MTYAVDMYTFLKIKTALESDGTSTTIFSCFFLPFYISAYK